VAHLWPLTLINLSLQLVWIVVAIRPLICLNALPVNCRDGTAPNTAAIPAKKIQQTRQKDNAETAKTRFRRFCHYPTGALSQNHWPIFLEYSISPQHTALSVRRNTVYRYSSCFILLMATVTATAQTPIPRVGDSCLSGTYKSGDYCKPFKSSEDQTIIEKSGSKCPTGFYSSGNYCKQYPSQSDKDAIPREKGKDCPSGWYKSSGYCVRNSD
jgi:hypothetical protein